MAKLTEHEYAKIRRRFSENLFMLIAERGWDKQTISTELFNSFNLFLLKENKKMVSRFSFLNWIHKKTLPNYQNFLNLADWLDCYPHDLLSENLQQHLSGYFKHQNME